MKTTAAILTAIALASCSTTTTTTTTLADGKSVTTVVKKEPNEGIVTTITNALLGGFLNVFQAK